MRAFNTLVMDQVVRGTTEVTSPAEFDDQLGKADTLSVEVEVEDSSGTSPTLTARMLHSNSGKDFVGLSNFIAAASISSLPYRDLETITGPLGAKLRVGITLGGTNPSGRVRVWVCGRTS